MSHSIDERIRRLETEVEHLQVMPAAAIRARGRRRGRRQLATMSVAVAVVVTTAGITAWPHQRPMPGPAASPSTGPGVRCVVALPGNPAEVRIRVLDGGASAGRADATVTQLRKRDFTVLTDTAGPADHDAGSAALRYGPAAIGAATLLRAELHGDTTMSFDPNRDDDTIDVTLGATFARLATMTEVNQALVTAGEPAAPPQCSARR